MNRRLFVFLFLIAPQSVVMSAEAPGAPPSQSVVVVALTKEAYRERIQTSGVVLLDVNWGRHWNCGGFENAELRKIEFDRLPATKSGDADKADFILEGPPRLLTKPTFLNYGFILPPGDYALSGYDIKVARSVTDVGHLIAKRSELIKNGQPDGGTFTVRAGEVVYLGNFYLDCQQRPMLWRYYVEGAANFQKQVGEYQRKFPFIEPQRIRYRLFKSKLFGLDYDLPESAAPGKTGSGGPEVK